MSQQASSCAGGSSQRRYDRWHELAGSVNDRRWETRVDEETEDLCDDIADVVADVEYFIELIRDIPRDNIKDLRYQILKAITRLAKIARDL